MIKLIKSTFYREKETKNKLLAFLKNAKQLSFGPECIRFEKRFAHWQKRKFCVFVNSGSSANLALIQALLNTGRIKKRDSVGFSSVTWSTNVMPLIQLGLNPVPIDVELDTLNISSKKLSEVLKSTDIKLLFVTNLLGFCDDLEEIANICRKKKIILIEDNCEGLGSVYQGKRLGNYGLASTFSFYVGHQMSTIEGGAICCDDEELTTMLVVVRAHGWDRNLKLSKQNEIRKKFQVNSTFYSRYTFYDLGYNLRTTEINGFIGNVQLNFLNEITRRRQANFLEMIKPISKKSDLYYPLKFHHLDTIANFAVPIICKNTKIRDDLVKKCSGRVEIRPIVGGNMRLQPFFKKYVKTQRNCPNAELIHKQGLYFGNNPEMTALEKKSIVKLFAE